MSDSMWGKMPVVKIGGKVVHASSMVFDPGIRLSENNGSIYRLQKPTPSITIAVSIGDYELYSENHVRLVFATKKRWKFPDDRFVSYDQSDESWCRYLGIGHEVEYNPVIEMQNAFVEDADYDRVRFVGSIEHKNCDVDSSCVESLIGGQS